MEERIKKVASVIEGNTRRHEYSAAAEKYNLASPASKEKLQKELATKMVRMIVFSREFLFGFLLLTLFFATALPFGTDAATNIPLAHALMFFGCLAFPIFIRFTLPSITLLRMRGLSFFGYFAIVTTFYSSTALLYIFTVAMLIIRPDQFEYANAGIFMALFISILMIATLIASAARTLLIGDRTSGGMQLMNKLPHHIRGKIVSMRSEDHYLEVTTVKGCTLIRLNLRDAIDLVGEDEGVQVHRSYWLSRTALSESQFDQNKRILTLADGQVVPVAKSRVPELIGRMAV